jgi:hypothetical protein
MKPWTAAALCVAALVAAAPIYAAGADAHAATSAFKYGFFKTPSGNVQCSYGYFNGSRANESYVVCGIVSGLKPPPPRRGPKCSVSNRVSLGVKGRAHTGRSICPGEDEGDAGPFGGQDSAKVLAYGAAWHGAGLRCTSELKGLTCRNPAGHGFFLSRAHWRSF